MAEFKEIPHELKCIATVSCRKDPFVIERAPGGRHLFHITSENLNVPKELKGLFTTLKEAKRFIENYERGNPKPTQAVKNEQMRELRKAKNASNSTPAG